MTTEQMDAMDDYWQKRLNDPISHENASQRHQNFSQENNMPVHGFTPAEGRTELPSASLAPLIGLGGRLRAGKDAVGDYLEEKHGYTKLGMSDALNEALLALNPWIPSTVPHSIVKDGNEYYYPRFERYVDLHAKVGYVEAKKNPEVRRLLQALGTEVGRNMISPSVWVDIAERKIQELRAQGKPVVITAVRFPNEVDMVNRLGGTTVWIERDTEARGASDEVINAHASETSVQAYMFEYVIGNHGTLEELGENVEHVLEMVGRGVHNGGVLPGGHVLPKRFGG